MKISCSLSGEQVEEEERTCGQDEMCVRQNDCPDFVESKMLLDKLSRGSSEYEKTLEELQETICNQRRKAVCCLQDEGKCNEGYSCIAIDHCGTAVDLKIQYENGNMDAKDLLIGLISGVNISQNSPFF